MLYLANPSTPAVRAAMVAGHLGQIITPAQGNRITPGVPWALDNGCFSNRWKPARFFDTLEKHARTPGCLFAVVPDVVADAAGTNRLWASWDRGLRRHGYPVAYVIQDGARSIPRWCDAVFVGGSDAFKLGPEARALVALAKRHGKWVHMGRVNSYKRLRYATDIGCDSADGTFLAIAPDQNLPRVFRWLDQLARPQLDLFAA